MEIENPSFEDIDNALKVIHRRASSYDGPLTREFMQLARLSARRSEDESEDESGDDGKGAYGELVGGGDQRELREQFDEALQLLMMLAFPTHQGTEEAVRLELIELLGESVESIDAIDDDRRINLSDHLGKRPTETQVELQTALLQILPSEMERGLEL